MALDRKSIIVTGGAGFIGSHLVDALIEQGYKVLVIDNLSTGKRENLNHQAEFYQKDIVNYKDIAPLFSGVDFVLHLAAIPGVMDSVKDPAGTTRVNILGTVNVFTAAKDAGVKRIVFAASSAAYGDQPTLPLREDMAPKPKSPYALQKLAGEEYARLFGELYDLPVICLRYFNVYGTRINISSEYALVLGNFLRLRKQGKPLTIYGNGEQTRDFVYVSDVVSANLAAMQSEKLKGGEVINIGGLESCSINHLADIIGGERAYLDERPGDVRHTKADITKAKELLGWEPKVGLEEGVKEVVDWYSNAAEEVEG